MRKLYGVHRLLLPIAPQTLFAHILRRMLLSAARAGLDAYLAQVLTSSPKALLVTEEKHTIFACERLQLKDRFLTLSRRDKASHAHLVSRPHLI
jgi:hypothetical protein